jgi:hypothetical protein
LSANASLACASLSSAVLNSTEAFVLAGLFLAMLVAFSLSDILVVAVERLPLEAQPTVSSMAMTATKEKNN